MTNEPLVTVAFITALVSAVINLIVQFGITVTADQQTAILGLTAVLGPLIVAAIGRRKVTPVSDV
jgi:hypothetical protein